MRFGWKTFAGMLMLGLAGGLAAQDATLDKDSTTNAQATTVNATQTSGAIGSTQTVSAKEGDGAVAGDSHVRIVRLSEAQGKVAMDRGTGKGFEQVMQNMPVVEGSKLATSDGYAAVEFEDGSSLRLAPNSEVEFPQLLLHSSGVKASTVRVNEGTVYVSLENTKDNEFKLEANDAKMLVAPATHLRLEMNVRPVENVALNAAEMKGSKTVLAVFAGDVEVQSGGTTTRVEKKESATLDAADASKAEVTKKVEQAAYDGWDEQAVDYQNRYSNAKSFAGAPYSYGVADLNYYGSFVNGGCGSMWQPYFVNSAWDPYGNGMWAWYQGAGYSWVSPYPWGWLPYHSGTWSYCSGAGWGWYPNGMWRGLVNVVPGVVGQPLTGRGGQNIASAGGVRQPALPTPPAAMSQTLVPANRQPLVMSKESSPGSFTFQQNSAGLGVPRGTLGGLKGVSSHVEQHGFVNMSVYSQPMANGGARSMNSGPATLRQGSPASRSEVPGGNWHGGGANSSSSSSSGSSSASHGSGGGFSGGGASGGMSGGGGGSSSSGGGKSK
jgi:hypothetical protein